ncbi:MAG: isoprenylcysteine carboxylmethyltransferase family protein [Elusimicrobia bacterium]|nr:isoprenylcysteine carboxylmethyltransferase family protein [Elusimicrobiota bacterium]
MRIIRALIAVAGAWLLMQTGWGWDDPAGLWAEPSRFVGAVLFLAWVAGFLLSPLELTPKGKEIRHQMILVFVNICVLTCLFYAMPKLARNCAAIPWAAWTGVILLAAGVAVCLWSIHTLGRWFTPKITVQQGQTLIQKGPYRWLRHPFYFGLLLVITGFPLSFGRWIGMAIAVVYIPGILLRIHDEEKLLAGAFPGEFPAYRRKTRRLIPFVF